MMGGGNHQAFGDTGSHSGGIEDRRPWSDQSGGNLARDAGINDIGSSNQRVHFLTDRYHAGDPRWLRPNTLEIRLTATELTVNGFPARAAAGLWKPPSTSDQPTGRRPA